MAHGTDLSWRTKNPASPKADFRSNIPCQFYSKGRCQKGSECVFLHTGTPPARSTPASRDTRPSIPCRFFQLGTCLKGAECPFSHSATVEGENHQIHGGEGPVAVTRPKPSDTIAALHDLDKEEDDKNEELENWCREFGGAVVEYGAGATVTKVSFASDFSAIRLRSLPDDATTESVVTLLALNGESVPEAGVRIIQPTADDPSHCQADVRVEDAQFAPRTCLLPSMSAFSPVAVTNSSASQLSTAAATGLRRVDSKKVFVSWHKSTKLVWLNFGNGDIANKIAERFQKGIYTVSGQRVQAKSSFSEAGYSHRRSRYQQNRQAWTVVLSDVPAAAAEAEITEQIPQGQRPRHVEMDQEMAGRRGDEVDLATASALIHSHILQAGPLEWWEESTGALSSGKRHKAKARFLHEADAARAVDMFNGEPLPFDRLKLLTVQLVHTARLKIAADVYNAAAGTIMGHVRDWKAKHVQYTAYPAVLGFRMLKIEGAVRQDVASTKAMLETILLGETAVQSDGKTPLWSPLFSGNGGSGRKMHPALTKLGIKFGVVILCDRQRSRLRVVGTPARKEKVEAALAELVRDMSSATSTATSTTTMSVIPLDRDQLAWACRGGFRAIVDAVGPDQATLDIVSTPKRILVSGEDAYQKIVAILLGRDLPSTPPAPHGDQLQALSESDGATCAVCWTEAENAVRTACQHVYCGSCFEDLCKSGANRGIYCVGDMASCNIQLPLVELQAHLPSAALEDVLETSFSAHMACHLDDFRYCPTADCGQIYRVAKTAASATATAALFTCPSCLAPVCRVCHVDHEGISCAEHRDRASGGYEALKVAKKKLGIKDCPQCSVPIEKISGCNHMTCTACQAHICWVCMNSFPRAKIYGHLQDVHGGHTTFTD